MCMYTCMRACVCVRVYTMLYEYAASLMLTIAGLFKQNTLLLRLTPRSLSLSLSRARALSLARSLSLCVCASRQKGADGGAAADGEEAHGMVEVESLHSDICENFVNNTMVLNPCLFTLFYLEN